MAYLGTQPNNTKKNIGLYTPNEILQLTKEGSWGGTLELIDRQTVTASAGIEFTNIKEDVYSVHYLKFNSLHQTSTTNNTTYRLRVSTNGGTSYKSSGYENASQSLTSGSSFTENKSTSATELFLSFTSDNATNNANANGYCYLYNLGDSTRYSFQTYQTVTQINNSTFVIYFGGGVRDTTEVVNALQITTSTGSNFDGSFELFGIKKI